MNVVEWVDKPRIKSFESVLKLEVKFNLENPTKVEIQISIRM